MATTDPCHNEGTPPKMAFLGDFRPFFGFLTMKMKCENFLMLIIRKSAKFLIESKKPDHKIFCDPFLREERRIFFLFYYIIITRGQSHPPTNNYWEVNTICIDSRVVEDDTVEIPIEIGQK